MFSDGLMRRDFVQGERRGFFHSDDRVSVGPGDKDS